MLDQDPQVKQTNEHKTEKDSINGNEYVYYFKKGKNDSSQTEYNKLDSLMILKNGKRYVLNLLNKNIVSDVLEGGYILILILTLMVLMISCSTRM